MVTILCQILDLLELLDALNWICCLIKCLNFYMLLYTSKRSLLWFSVIKFHFFSIFLGFIVKNAFFWLWTRSFAAYPHCCLIQDHLTSHNLLLIVALLIFGVVCMTCAIIGISLYFGYFYYAIQIPCMIGWLFFIAYYYNFDLTSHILWKHIASYLCNLGTLLTVTS